METGLKFSLAHLRSLFRWVIQIMVLDSWQTICAGPFHRPFSSIFGDRLLSQYIHSCPHDHGWETPRDWRSAARRSAWLLSARRKAALAAVRNSRCLWKRVLASSVPWQLGCAEVSSSETTDAGSFGDLPSTACSGLYPSMMDMLFLALKHWASASSKCWASSIISSSSIRSSISLTVAP